MWGKDDKGKRLFLQHLHCLPELGHEAAVFPSKTQLRIQYEKGMWAFQFSSIQFSRSVMSDSLQPHEPQHARPPSPSPTPRVHPNPCPLSRCYHPTISSSVVPSPALNVSQNQGLFKWLSSSHQVAKVLKFQLQHQSFQWTAQDWSPLGWTGWISLQSKGLSRVFSNTTVQKHQFFSAQLSL